MQDNEGASREAAKEVAALAKRHGCTVAVAESLTSGSIASALGEAPDSSNWFSGSAVAYRSETKFRLLGVTRGPVITAQCAREMAIGVRLLMDASVAVSVTGVGGPGPEEGRPAGTVYIGVASDGHAEVFERSFDGEPAEIIEKVTLDALLLLENAMQKILA